MIGDDRMTKISVIVPIYRGKQYIPQMIQQIELCAARVDAEVELILVNDDPEVPLEMEMSCETIEIHMINTVSNCGIHGARVKGLQYARGEFVLFLDQDDKIYPAYLVNQLKKIGNADAVVCMLINANRAYYDKRRPFQDVVCKKHILFEDNIIVSPGQVLLRTDAISPIWKNTIVKNNGADDWLLWICMYGEEKTFCLNDEILFEHVVQGDNASWQTRAMMLSEHEVFEIVKSKHVLKPEEEEGLRLALERKLYQRIDLLDKFKRMFYVYDNWIKLSNRKICPFDGWKSDGIRSVAIYGVNDIGRRLCEQLKEQDFFVAYYIDVNADYLDEAIPVYPPEDELKPVDAVIVALVEQEQEIKEMLKQKQLGPVILLQEFLKESADCN